MKKIILYLLLCISVFRVSAQLQCNGMPTVTYGGQTYNTVKIGTQCWLQENINIGTFISSSTQQTDNCIIEKYCYNDDTANCTIYGGLYQWAEMVRYYRGATNSSSMSPALGSSFLQGICPPGWHIPSSAEWVTLFNVYDASFSLTNNISTIVGGKLKETGTVHWNSPNTGADNSSGFTALGAGYYSGSSFGSIKNYEYFASVDDVNYSSNYIYFTNNNSNGVLASDMKTLGLSVRCISGQGIDYNQIQTPPTSATASPSIICSGSFSTLTVIGGGLGVTGNWHWYKGSCGGSPIGTGSPLIFIPGITKEYYVRAEACGNYTSCVSVTITIINASNTNAVINVNDTICKGISTTLNVSGGTSGTGQWYWYTVSCTGTLAGSGSTISIVPFADTTYWVKAITSCNTTTCISISFSVSTSSISADSISLISGWKSQIHLTENGGSLGTGANWFWYASTCGGTKVGSGTIFQLYSPTNATKYYVRAEGSCNLTACKSITIAASSINANEGNFSIHMNFTNPVTKGSTLSYYLPYSSKISLSLFNLYGTKVSQLFNGFNPAGENSMSFGETNISSGVYLLQLKTEYGSINKKLVYIIN